MPDDVERRLAASLNRRAATAAPPVDAWSRFVERARRSETPDAPGGQAMYLVAGQSGSDDPALLGAVFAEPVREPRRDGPSWRLLGLAAAVVALLGAAVAVSSVLDGGDRPQSTAADPAEAERAQAVVEEVYEAFNRGDVVAWAAAAGAPGDPELEDMGRFALAIGSRYRDVLCDDREFGEFTIPWADAVPEPVVGQQVVCIATLENEMTRASGIVLDETTTWVVSDDVVLYSSGSAVEDAEFALDAFRTGFGAWLRSEHPEVLAAAGVSWDPYSVDFRAETMPDLLPWLDDYVDADDRWPVTEG